MKKKKGIKDEVQLTSKQKEMMQAQLDKESSIRKRLQGVWKQSDLSKTERWGVKFLTSPSWHMAFFLLSPAGYGVTECGGSAGSHSDRETTSDHQRAPCGPPGPNTSTELPSGCSTHPADLLGHRSLPYAPTTPPSRYVTCLAIVLYW